jgi:hypothetical protein
MKEFKRPANAVKLIEENFIETGYMENEVAVMNVSLTTRKWESGQESYGVLYSFTMENADTKAPNEQFVSIGNPSRYDLQNPDWIVSLEKEGDALPKKSNFVGKFYPYIKTAIGNSPEAVKKELAIFFDGCVGVLNGRKVVLGNFPVLDEKGQKVMTIDKKTGKEVPAFPIILPKSFMADNGNVKGATATATSTDPDMFLKTLHDYIKGNPLKLETKDFMIAATKTAPGNENLKLRQSLLVEFMKVMKDETALMGYGIIKDGDKYTVIS